MSSLYLNYKFSILFFFGIFLYCKFCFFTFFRGYRFAHLGKNFFFYGNWKFGPIDMQVKKIKFTVFIYTKIDYFLSGPIFPTLPLHFIHLLQIHQFGLIVRQLDVRQFVKINFYVSTLKCTRLSQGIVRL